MKKTKKSAAAIQDIAETIQELETISLKRLVPLAQRVGYGLREARLLLKAGDLLMAGQVVKSTRLELSTNHRDELRDPESFFSQLDLIFSCIAECVFIEQVAGRMDEILAKGTEIDRRAQEHALAFVATGSTVH